jgi:hypothetical protein
VPAPTHPCTPPTSLPSSKRNEVCFINFRVEREITISTCYLASTSLAIENCSCIDVTHYPTCFYTTMTATTTASHETKPATKAKSKETGTER